MNTKEIEEAAEVITKTVMPYMEADSNEKHYETLLSLAQEYLAVKGLPLEKNDICEFDSRVDIGEVNKAEHRGFNDCLHLCKLALLRKEAEWKEKLPNEEELEKLIFDNVFDELGKYPSKRLATAIRKMMEERMR